jgi:hypothetical protein
MVPDDLASQERHCGAGGTLQVTAGELGRCVSTFYCIKSIVVRDNMLEILLDFVIFVQLWYFIKSPLISHPDADLPHSNLFSYRW